MNSVWLQVDLEPHITPDVCYDRASLSSGTTSERHHGYDREDYYRNDQSFHLRYPDHRFNLHKATTGINNVLKLLIFIQVTSFNFS